MINPFEKQNLKTSEDNKSFTDGATIENLGEILEIKLQIAKDNAPDLTPSEFKNLRRVGSEEVRNKLAEAVVQVDTLFEFKRILEMCGLPKDWIQRFLAHENAHANKAESVGAVFNKYEVAFLREDKTVMPRLVSVSIGVHDHLSKEESSQMWTDIISAPEEYGSSLSEHDIEDLKNFASKDISS